MRFCCNMGISRYGTAPGGRNGGVFMNTQMKFSLGEQAGALGILAMPDSNDPDVLWAWLETTLYDACGIQGIFYMAYPVGDSGGDIEELLERAVWKTSYPQAYLEALPGNPLTDDRSAMHLLETGEISRWHDSEQHALMTPGEKRRREIDAVHGMSVGACFPVRTRSGRICGGFGLRSASQDEGRFDAMLTAHSGRIGKLLDVFDEKYRSLLAKQQYGLSPQETRVLAHLAGGMAVSRLAHEMGLSPKTIEAYMRSARQKTTSATSAEAVAKAIFFNLV